MNQPLDLSAVESRPSLEVSPLYTLWSVQDTLLQYYRTMFIAAESLLVVVAVTVAASANPLAWVLIVVGLALLATWSTMTRRRARDVQFAQKMILCHEAGQYLHAPFTTFRRYQKEWPHKRSFTFQFIDGGSEPFIEEGLWPPPHCKFWTWSTRLQMEIVLPSAYFLIWVAIIIYVAVASYPSFQRAAAELKRSAFLSIIFDSFYHYLPFVCR